VGIEFEVRVPDVEELTAGPPGEVVLENAYRKAAAIARTASGRLVLGVDTVVAIAARIYGKPPDEAAARTTLHALAGRRHAVISGVCLIDSGTARTAAATTLVQFRAAGPQLIDWYLSTGEWRQRAGGYAIQGRGAALVAGIEGDYLNVVGLPLATLLELAPGLLAAT
jgi:septum formation protein